MSSDPRYLHPEEIEAGIEYAEKHGDSDALELFHFIEYQQEQLDQCTQDRSEVAMLVSEISTKMGKMEARLDFAMHQARDAIQLVKEGASADDPRFLNLLETQEKLEVPL